MNTLWDRRITISAACTGCRASDPNSATSGIDKKLVLKPKAGNNTSADKKSPMASGLLAEIVASGDAPY
jgi:hypothetical protein